MKIIIFFVALFASCLVNSSENCKMVLGGNKFSLPVFQYGAWEFYIPKDYQVAVSVKGSLYIKSSSAGGGGLFYFGNKNNKKYKTLVSDEYELIYKKQCELYDLLIYKDSGIYSGFFESKNIYFFVESLSRSEINIVFGNYIEE
ncbi:MULTISPECIES: hypothetical protein [unclassified Neptuniibacter]|uniref:hypothetical protein n=1 Tax=unclassified Neptuniibacter TaxID=2630693 RepID=UPI0025DB3549|nr:MULTISPECIES: hypothetical protein [unclassified Neptuniibacter]|tara:strand:- start:6478 stop:6909 length:432 start_codon:yes stop_codon:yes gene_type:complete